MKIKLIKGFTLIELLIYIALFALVAGIFTGILVVVLRIQGQQIGLLEVSNQLNFVMQTIQRHVRESSTITSPVPGVSDSSLSLDSGATVIALGNCGGVSNAICVNNEPITTKKIMIPDLTFTHYITPSNHPDFPDTHAVQIKITAKYNTTNPAQQVTRTLQSSASPLKL